MSGTGSYVYGACQYSNYSLLHFIFRSGLQLDLYNSISLVYCTERKELTDYSVWFWLKPFEIDLWILIGVLFVLDYVWSHRQDPFSKHSGRNTIWKYFLSVSSNAGTLVFLALSIIYGNCLLSFLVSGDPHPKYLSLRDLLLSGFRISIFGDTRNKTIESFDIKLGATEFGFINSFERHEKHFYNTSYQVHFEMMMNKSVIVFDTSAAHLFLAEYTYAAVQLGKQTKISCHVLPEKINESPFFWRLYTVNRDWIRAAIRPF